jgi:hypothetical protein
MRLFSASLIKKDWPKLFFSSRQSFVSFEKDFWSDVIAVHILAKLLMIMSIIPLKCKEVCFCVFEYVCLSFVFMCLCVSVCVCMCLHVSVCLSESVSVCLRLPFDP